MDYKRILTIQDISCVGQCSMTVALPILSVCGHETCILPTAILSTHTGGFGKPFIIHLDGALAEIWHHWKISDVRFDCILIGYLGSVEAVHMAMELASNMLEEGGILIVDPAMADHGKLYSGFNDIYVQAIHGLCQKADIILPNMTEAAMLSGLEYREEITECYVNRLLDALNHKCVVLTGVGYRYDQTGVVLAEKGMRCHYGQTRVGASFHGTGDIFSASFTGSLMKGRSRAESVEIAADFTKRCIENTVINPAHWYGVKFEPVLPELAERLK